VLKSCKKSRNTKLLSLLWALVISSGSEGLQGWQVDKADKVWLVARLSMNFGNWMPPNRSDYKIVVSITMTLNRIFSIFGRNSRSSQSFHEFKYRLYILATWIPAVIFFNENIGELATINGPSMYPYLNPGFNENVTRDICWVNKWYPTRKLERGMIVWFRWV